MNSSESYKKRIRFDSSKGFPEGEHLAIIKFDSIYIEGDERSRTNPGHGYPAHTEQTMSYTAFKLEDREAWLFEIEELMGVHSTYSSKKDFIALDRGVKVNPTLKVQVELPPVTRVRGIPPNF
jgi:hypothetical protein